MIEKTPHLSIAQAMKFVMRFSSLPGFPNDEEERRNFAGEMETVPGAQQFALIRAFQSSALGQAHGERICRMLEDGVRSGSDENACHFAPQPVDVYHAAMRLAEGNVRDYDATQPPSCMKCKGTGFVRAEATNGYSAVTYCTCHAAYKAKHKTAKQGGLAT